MDYLITDQQDDTSMTNRRRQKSAYPKFRYDPFICHFQPYVITGFEPCSPFGGRNVPSVVKTSDGFTLIELMVTLAVVAVLAIVAVPNLQNAIQNSRIIGLTNDLLSDINYARTEALKRATNVGICMSTSGTACDGASWQNGRIIFADTNNDGALSAGELILRAREGLRSNTLTSTAPNPIIFGSRSLPMAGPFYTSPWTNPATFSLCDSRGTSQRRLIAISITGTASSSLNPGSC